MAKKVKKMGKLRMGGYAAGLPGCPDGLLIVRSLRSLGVLGFEFWEKHCQDGEPTGYMEKRACVKIDAWLDAGS